ncbi:MAG: hypothetical protein QOF02_1931 [Blastocatellia bacterium]|nr:hypothetical protein [Blastocatellia bacterium]
MKRWNAVLLGAVALLVVAGALINRKPVATHFVEENAMNIPSSSAAGPRVPVLLELFTSEGCSSCPPADDLLSQLDKTQPLAGVEVIALSQHVDYWNQLGWADPYSTAEFSARQSDYSAAFKLDGVYTPQMVVDGQAEFVGSNRERARDAITSAARSPKATVILKRDESGGQANATTAPLQLRIENLPPISAGDTAEVLLAVTESDLLSSVSRGENSGRRLTHTAVVRQLSIVGTAGSNAAFKASPVVTIAKDWKRDNLRAVVFVQERASRKVLGAATTSLAVQ